MAAMTGYDADTKGGKFPHRYRSAVLSYGGSDPAFAQDRRFFGWTIRAHADAMEYIGLSFGAQAWPRQSWLGNWS